MPAAWDKIREIKEHFEQLLLRKANVVGVAVGHKVTDGRETDEPCIVVLVKRKLPEGQLRPEDLVPRRLNNVSTDVVESGEIKALQLLDMQGKPRTARWRPAPGGVSIGHIDITAGTLGCLVERHGEIFILSNNHVLANANLGKVGDPVLQPGPYDGGQLSSDRIATLEAFVPIRFEGQGSRARGAATIARLLGPVLRAVGLEAEVRSIAKASFNRVDCAIARPMNPSDVSSEILQIGTPSGVGDAQMGMAIRKSGRTTGLRSDKVRGLEGTVRVDYGEGREAVFRGQILAGPMSEGGDSGAAVLDDQANVVGLLFAGSSSTTVINPVTDVLQALSVAIHTR